MTDTVHIVRARRPARFVPHVSGDRTGWGVPTVALECPACATRHRWAVALDGAARARQVEAMLVQWVRHADAQHPRRLHRSLSASPAQREALRRIVSPRRVVVRSFQQVVDEVRAARRWPRPGRAPSDRQDASREGDR